MVYNLSAITIDKTPVGMAGEDKGKMIRKYPLLGDVSVPRESLVSFLQQPMLWSNFQYVNNKRAQENCKLSTELLVFDIDNNTSFEVIKKSFHDIFQSVIIMPSGGWKKEYEKYRVIIPFENVDIMSNHHYKMLMTYIAGLLPFEVDTKPFEIGRLYFSDKHPLKEAYDSGGINKSDILTRAVIGSASSIAGVDNGYYLLKPSGKRFKNDSQIMPEFLVKKVKYKAYLDDIHIGNCHNGMIAMIGYLKKCGCLAVDIESHLRDLAGCGGCNPSELALSNRIALGYR